MFLLLTLHLAVALVLVIARRSLRGNAFLVAAVVPLALLTWALFQMPGILSGDVYTERVEWVPALGLELLFRVDGYALLFLLVVAGAGIPVFLYSRRYFSTAPKVAVFAAIMAVFAGSMAGLVASDHLLGVFIFWELTTITSYLLIGFDDHKAQARSAALHAALVTGAGGLAMLGGFVLLARETGTYVISEIVANPPQDSATIAVAWGLILLGAITKSAQFPFHGWLPGAMAAPTPASALLHSATMVKAGIFLVGRLGVVAVSTGWWEGVVLTLGLATMALGGWRALRQTDLKLLLAFGTVSQLGFIFLLVGSGKPELVFGGLALLVAHALFKATLFLVVGTIDHEVGTRDLNRLSGLRHAMPVVFWTALLAALSMAAAPLTFGFVAKEAAFDGLVKSSTTLIALAALASVLTVAYTVRFLVGAFGAHDPAHEPAYLEGNPPRNLLMVAPLLLVVTSVVVGLVPSLLFPLIDKAALAATGVAKAGKLVLWPGLVPALGWSAATLVIGGLLAWATDPRDRVVGAVGRIAGRLPTADGVFRKTIPALITFADRASGAVQNGSLPAYLATILLVAVLAPTLTLLADFPGIAVPEPGSGLELVLGVLIIGFAVALVFVRRRFAVVLLLGGVGYGIAGLYSVLGGPDLSLTQLLVETLAVALFAFVLRYLPATFSRPATARGPRLLVAAAVGLFIFGAGVVAFGSRATDSVSSTYLADAVPVAAGSNVVNVILVDFRAFDTLGEITVLVAAALGVAGLVLPVFKRAGKG